MERKIHIPERRIRRTSNLGQLDHEMDYGPKPVERSDVPVDLLPRYIREGAGLGVGGGVGSAPDMSQLVNDVHSIAGVFVLRRGLLGRVVTITGTPQAVISAQYPRGYLVLNPAGVVGLTAVGTLFSSTTLVGATTLLSGDLGVANFKTLRLTLKVTAMVGAGPVTFDAQTLDPVDGTTFITTQTAFSVTTTGNFYANLGTLGVDTDFKLFVTVPGGTTITFTVGFITKDGLQGTSSGIAQTIFLGGAGVTSVSGFPLLAGIDKSFYLMENLSLFAVTSGPSLNLNVFEL